MRISLKAHLRPAKALNQTPWYLSSALQAELPLQLMQDAVADNQKLSDEIELKDLSFEQQTYSLSLTLRPFLFLWDDIQFSVDLSRDNQISLSLKDNWIPTDLILERVEARLKSALEKVPLKQRRQGDQIVLTLDSDAELFKSIQFKDALLQADIDVRGNLNLGLQIKEDPDAPASPSFNLNHPNIPAHSHFVMLQTKLCGDLTQIEGDYVSKIDIALLPDEIKGISLGSEKLIDRLQLFVGYLNHQGSLKLATKPFTIAAKGQFEFDLERMEIEGKQYQELKSVPFQWSYSELDGFNVAPQLPPVPAIQARHKSANLRLIIDGPTYFAEMKQALWQAQESIEQEVFAFHDGKTASELAQIYILKAIGLSRNNGQFISDPRSPAGIPVRLLHNHYLTRKGTQEVSHLFERETEILFAQFAKQGNLNPIELKQRLKQNLQITALTDGVAWTDHRKLLIIDGRLVYTGGRNIGDNYFTEDAYHDQMMQVRGPLVHDLHRAFIENWQKLNPNQTVNWNFKPEKDLQADLQQPTVATQVLTTSHQGWQAQAGLIQLIQQAKKIIRLEHAYIFHEPIEEALRQAKARGVEIQLLFSEKSDESLFDLINPGTALKLMRAPGSGKVRVWLYPHRGGQNNYMVHTKFLSIDGTEAIAGSANLIPRSLQSPFTSEGKPILFNEELVLWIKDPVFVSQMDRELFETDQKVFSREVNETELEKLIEAKGGALQLMIERLKGLLT